MSKIRSETSAESAGRYFDARLARTRRKRLADRKIANRARYLRWCDRLLAPSVEEHW